MYAAQEQQNWYYVAIVADNASVQKSFLLSISHET